ncbi:hypothetical protein JXB41_08040 [Candidatus Woesearchaeota archaeon]|nr:hypothetical protein [Candidatus Woesearchaeota archaeon]
MIHKKITTMKKDHTMCCRGFSGIVFILIGLIWLMDDVGYISLKISLWPFIFICIGLAILFHKFRYYHCKP